MSKLIKFFLFNLWFIILLFTNKNLLCAEFIYGIRDIYLKDSLFEVIDKLEEYHSFQIEKKGDFLNKILPINPYDFLDIKSEGVPLKIKDNIFFFNIQKSSFKTKDYKFYPSESKNYIQFLKIKKIHLSSKRDILNTFDRNLTDISLLFYENNLYSIAYSLNLDIYKFQKFLKEKSELYGTLSKKEKINEYLFQKIYFQNPFLKVLYDKPQNFISMTIKKEDRLKNLNIETFQNYQKANYKYTLLTWIKPSVKLHFIYHTSSYDKNIQLYVVCFDKNLYKKVTSYFDFILDDLKKRLLKLIEDKKIMIINYLKTVLKNSENEFTIATNN